MNQAFLEKYAALIVHYCVSVQPGDKVYIRTTTLALPLLREIHKMAYKAGAAQVEYSLEFEGQQEHYLELADSNALESISPLYQAAIESFDCYIYIRAPFPESIDMKQYASKIAHRNKVLSPLNQVYMERTGRRSLKRTLCEYPTLAAAKRADMTLEDYTSFIIEACKLNAETPLNGWLDVRDEQQRIVDFLNTCSEIRYLASHTDIRFSTKGRTWINSDGQTNMPSGEVYTSPVENSVEGHIHFTLPGHYMGQQVKGVTLHVKNGRIEQWESDEGQAFLDEIFAMPGTRHFGEAAIGTNYNITQMTNNILFDEKIGGTVHMAIGQSYQQCGGKNESSVHWDMITEMTVDGQIFADGKLIYEKGMFLI